MAFIVDGDSRAALDEYVRARRVHQVTSEFLFVNARGGRLSVQGIANALSVLARTAGIQRRVTPHMFRHTAATLFLRNGASLRHVQEFLGHSSIATTQRYTHVVCEDLRRALQDHHPKANLVEPKRSPRRQGRRPRTSR
jgi:site-specific recombinase XerD